jgi:gamma-glutamylcyclotransferase (GGCT)/AIG2-like uncharacterized protein YtfP
MKAPIFVYGTLSHPQVVQTLLGRTIAFEFPTATLSGFSRHPVKNCVFPGIIPNTPQNQVDGFLLENLSDLDRKLLDWYEGDEYDGRTVQVSTETSTQIHAEVYIWKPHLLEELKLDEKWCYKTFCKDNLEWYLENTVRPCRFEMENLGMTKP